jgi:DNA-binding CsgD family transcriptional regulator
VIVAALAAAVAVIAWAIATYAVGSGSRPTNATQVSALSGLTPREREYVLGIVALTPAQLRLAFGTDRPTGESSGQASLTPQERRYAQAIAALSRPQQAAAFGTGR